MSPSIVTPKRSFLHRAADGATTNQWPTTSAAASKRSETKERSRKHIPTREITAGNKKRPRGTLREKTQQKGKKKRKGVDKRSAVVSKSHNTPFL